MLVLNLGHTPLIVSTQPLPTPYIKGMESHCLFCFNFYLHEIIVQQHQEEVFHSPSRLLSIAEEIYRFYEKPCSTLHEIRASFLVFSKYS